MTALSIGTDAHIAVESETNEEITEQDSVILRITAATSQEALH